MTTVQRLLLSGVALGAVSGCGSQHADRSDAQPPFDSGGMTPPFDGALDYARTGGFISTRTTVHIEPDGRMVRVKPDGSTSTSTLPPATMSDLKHKVDQAEFATLEAEYPCSCNDDFLHTITVGIGATSYKVMANELADYPARLRPLIDTLSMMSQAELTGN